MHEKIQSIFEVKKIVSLIVIYILESLLFLILLPFMIWEWISTRDHVISILKAIFEVTLELIIWIIFAGVSILITAVFIFDDVYSRKMDHETQEKYLPIKPFDYEDKHSYIVKSSSFEKGQVLS